MLFGVNGPGLLPLWTTATPEAEEEEPIDKARNVKVSHDV